MDKNKAKQLKRLRRKGRVRAKISGTSDSPRLSVFKSNSSVYLQIIDDVARVTLASANMKELEKKGKKQELAFELGKLIAKKALDKKIEKVVFDRGANKYHGRVKAVADGAREAGLNF